VTQIVQAYDADDRRRQEGGVKRNRAPNDHDGS
jgi:hypothetical protein